jgi:hypothetical protein
MLLTDERSNEVADRIRNAVEQALAARKLSARRASMDVVGHDGLIRDIRAGRIPSVDRVEALFQYLGLEVYFGPKRAPDPVATLELDGTDFARIPLHEASFSAGPGVENGDGEVVGHLVFGADWLRKAGVKPESAVMARVSGDSMAPGIQSGDLVMIDTTRREVPAFRKTKLPAALPIFAFIQDNEARVKRLERRPAEKILVLYSDNRDVPPELLSERDAHTLNILGQVVWSGHVWR